MFTLVINPILGQALIEVSEIREPCWKIQAKYNIPDLVKRMSDIW